MRKHVGLAWLGASAGVVLGLLAAPLGAQEVRLSDEPRGSAQEALAAFLDRGGYEVWTGDTVLARGDTVERHVLVLEGVARIAGRVEGDVYVVDGDLILRVAGSIGGDVVVLAGLLLDSDLATVEGEITYRPNERLRVVPEAGGYTIFSARQPLPALELDGQYGFHLPTYQRVDALTFGWGATVRAPRAAGRPELGAVARYKTGPQKVEGSVRASVNASERVRLFVAASRATRSNDEWIRPTWVNTLGFAFAGDDYRDYYRADRVGAGLEWGIRRAPDWRGGTDVTLTVGAGWEEARSLEARDVTILFAADDVRANPAIDPGDVYSAWLGLALEDRRDDSRTRFGLTLEAASKDVGGDFSFLWTEARLALSRPAFGTHSVELFAIGRGDLAGTLPRQRWSGLGRTGTLPTFPVLSLRGERLLYGEATYAVPLYSAGSLGALEAFFRGSAGTAWGDADSFRLEENATLGLRARVWGVGLEVGVASGFGGEDGESDVQVFVDLRLDRPTGGRGPAGR